MGRPIEGRGNTDEYPIFQLFQDGEFVNATISVAAHRVIGPIVEDEGDVVAEFE